MSLTPSKRLAEDQLLPLMSESNLLSPGANADLLKALQIEAGRLMSDNRPMSEQFSPLPEGVEVGRRVSEVSAARESLPISPLRSPLGAVEEIGGDDFGLPLGDDGDYPPLPMEENAAPASDNALPQLPISPPQSAAKRPRRRPRTSAAALVMDEETELSHLHNSLPQIVQKKNAKAKLLSLLSRPLASEDVFADLFNDITLSSPARHSKPLSSLTEQQPEAEEQMEEQEKMEEDVFGGEDIAPMMMEDEDYTSLQPEKAQSPAALVGAVADSAEDLVIPAFPFNLQTYLMGVNRRKASQIFFKVLAGCNNSEFRAVQSEPFGPISLIQF